MTKHLQKRQDFIRGRREKRKLARHARTRRQVLRYTLLLVLVGAAICGFTYLPWSIRSLANDVTIHGNQVVSDLQVRKAVGTALNQPLYTVDPRKLQTALCALPAVRHAFVRRYVFPHPQLRVEIMEEFPWATYAPTSQSAPEGVISETGRYIPLALFPKVVQPALRISGQKSLKLAASDIAQWDQWVRLIEGQTGQPVALVDMSNPTAVQAYSGGYELHLGAVDSTLQRRIGRLASVMPTIASLKQPLEYIDLSLDSNIPLKVDKSPKSGAASRATDASLLPTDHSVPLSTVPSVAATSTAPSF
jgi:cell division septal protein FtsQ